MNTDAAREPIPTPNVTNLVAEGAPSELAELLRDVRLLLEEGEFEAAHARVGRLRPNQRQSIEARLMLAELAMFRGELEEARRELLAVLAVAPASATALHDYATVALWSRDYARAIDLFARAVELESGAAHSAYGLAQALFAAGRYQEGWRWNTAVVTPPNGAARPRGLWDGSAIEGTLAVFPEEGLGDVVQFCRYVPMIRSRVGRVYLVLDGYYANLAPLLASLQGVDMIVPDRRRGPPINAYCPLLTLAGLADAAPERPGPVPYLRPPADRVARWRERLEQRRMPRVGIAWRGSAGPTIRERNIGDRRSIDPKLLGPLMQVEGIQWYSLQLPAPRDSSQALPPEANVVDHTDEFRDFAETAALMANLDLVVTVDTSVAHVAGAIGTPVWMMNRFDTCWRWAGQGASTPWYPSMRLFHQPAFGDWPSVIAETAAALTAWRRDVSPG